ncbi:MAG: NEW3 domain-containing protein [Chloroflexota bacterium]
MSRKPLINFSLFLILILVVSFALLGQVTVQGQGDPSAVPPTASGPITVSGTEPGTFTNGLQPGVLSVFGTNFTELTTVRLLGLGLLQVTFVNPSALTAVLPPDLPAGQYGIEVSAPGGGTVNSPNTLIIVTPPPEPPTQGPPTAPPSAVPSAVPPTAVPGQPSLIVRDFVSLPSTTPPGGPVALSFVLVNQGNRTAQGVSVAIDSGGKFVPAGGQSGATLPDMPPGSSVQVSLNVLTAMDAAEGPTNVPITMSYYDFEGTAFTNKADLSVNVAARNDISQVTLVRYEFEPTTAVPGEPLTVRVSVSNTGNRAASRVLLRISGENGILLAGQQGDSFPLGDIAPGASVTADVPMIVNPSAEAGPQAQPVTLSYTQDGESKDTTTSMTIVVARVIQPEPLILLEDYDLGEGVEWLSPGDRFTLSMTLQNVGQGDAPGVLVTFGTVEGSSSSGGTPTGGGVTTPSNAFAPLGAGDTLFMGTLEAGGSLPIEQAFIVNSTVTSGIYSLPITVRYQKSDGSQDQQNLRASVIVIARLRLQTSLESPFPETINTGEPYPVTVSLVNQGTSTINLVSAAVTAENADILEGVESLLSPIRADDDDSVTALIMPQDEGKFTVTFTLTYSDDLNRERTMVLSYGGEAVTPPPFEPPPEIIPEPSVQEEDDNFLGRLLLGFLGLGG